MSGIAGILHFDGAPIEPEAIGSMTGAMAHRGPDGIRHWAGGGAALAHCMLRTTAESIDEQQPLASDDQTLVLVMDGRIDNTEDLRLELAGRGAVLRSRSDAELVLRAYEAWGRQCPAHLEGDFAFVLWDARRQQAFGARDRMGNKPFHYHWDGRTLVFASDPIAILRLPRIPQKLNPGLLVELLADEYCSADETVWQGILRLEAAHQFEASRNGLRLQSYWQPDPGQAHPFRRDEDFIDAYRSLFLDTVRRMTRSHCPVAFEVSGGLDSSAVFAAAHHLHRAGQSLAPGIRGYALAFPNDRNANELKYSRAVAAHLGVPVDEIPPAFRPLSWYRDWTSIYREFPGSPNGVMLWDLRQTARDHGCRVVVGGLGGDEWQGADSRSYYAEELASGRWRNLARCFLADRRAAGLGNAIAWAARFGLVPFLPDPIRHGLRCVGSPFRAQPDPRVRDGAWLNEAGRRLLNQRRNPDPPSVPMRRRGQVSLRQALDHPRIAMAIELEEKMASRLGLEPRQPLRSPRIVQFAFSTPERLRLRGWTNKYMHVEAMRNLLPPIVLNRKTKADFSSVFRACLDPLEDVLTREIPERLADWLDPERTRAVHDAYRERLASSNHAAGGQAQWILWNLFGCDLLVDSSK